jgi:ribosomal protein L11 methylase PrmA
MKVPATNRSAASFRDPSGFVFFTRGQPYRQINLVAKTDFERLHSSGLYKQLVAKGYLIQHFPASDKLISSNEGYKVVRAKKIPFISYPYEWSFSQLKQAALLTLKIQKLALERGMSLKDASAYNIQFIGTTPTLIDLLSLTTYQEGEPWIAYRQFCQHFLAPLLLMAKTDIRLNQLLRTNLDGIPLDLAAKLLPTRSKLNPGVFSHIVIHAKSQSFYSGKQVRLKKYRLSQTALAAIIDSLESLIRGLKLKSVKTEWGEYYEHTNYTKAALTHKKTLVKEYIGKTKPKTLWALGANTGQFAALASQNGIYTVAFDIDPMAIEIGYNQHQSDDNFLPLILDLTNPSGGSGWANKERDSLSDRGPADTVTALALIHHLAISNHLPFELIAEYFATLGKYLIIEFVPKTDSQVKRLLATREDIFGHYEQKEFEKVFSQRFRILNQERIKASARTLYLMKRK